MEKLIGELEKREVCERSESNRCTEENEDLPDMHVTCFPSSLRDYIKSKRNKNTIRKTESIVNSVTPRAITLTCSLILYKTSI